MNTRYNENVEGALSLITVNGAKYQLGKDATSEIGGIVKLYTALDGSATDGTVTQAALNTAIAAAKKAGDDAQSDLNAYKTSNDAKIGTVAEGKTVVEMISDAANAASGDNSALASRVSANENAIATLNGDGAGSVSKAVSDAVDSIINGAPATMDTLKEVSDWIENDQTGAAAMMADISSLKSGKKNVQAAVNLSGATDKTVTAFTQNANGDASVTYTTIQEASSSQHGLMTASQFNKLGAISATVTGDTLSIVTQAAA